MSNQENVSTHSRPKAAGGQFWGGAFPICEFQHTAARRRLAGVAIPVCFGVEVSTHSRPKAAGRSAVEPLIQSDVSTHSRPKAAGRAARHG